MSVKLSNFTSIFLNFTKNKKNIGIIFLIGVLGIILIGLSDTKGNSKLKSYENFSEYDCEAYIKTLENKTQNIVSSISGAGRCKIMITAELSREKEYAVDESISQEKEQNNLNLKKETEIVVIEDGGNKTPLVKKINEPTIRGVLVLCEGADNPKINEMITSAVKTVLGVSSNKIFVAKLK